MVNYRVPEPDAWTYDLGGGWVVLAGKTDRDNDLLSLSYAHPSDLWFHIHGLPGSHVLLQGPPGQPPTAELLKTAASIAAWHSKARNAGVVPVKYTEAKHVFKPRGAKPGSVTLKKEKTIKVKPSLPNQE